MKFTAFTKLIAGFSLSLVFLFSIIAFSYKSGNSLYHDFSSLEETYKVIHSLESILSLIHETEAKVKGYHIDSNIAYIEDYDHTIKEIYAEMDKLSLLIKHKPEQNENEKELRKLIKKRIELFDYSLNFKWKEDEHHFLVNAKLNEARLCMLHIKRVKEAMEKDEEILMKHLKKNASSNLHNTNYINMIAAALAFFVGIMAIFIIKNDIQERSRIEKNLRELDGNKNKFFSIISHDLRGPMNAIFRLAHFLTDEKNKPSTQDAEHMAKLIEKTVKKVNTLLENLLHWSRIQMDIIDFKPQYIKLKSMTEENIFIVQESANLKNIKIINNLAEDSIAFTDKNMFSSTVRNLISNAIKFTNAYGEVSISSKILNKKFIEITVGDNGIGMSKEEIGKLFDITYKYSKKGTANEEGSGLGLLLCKEFVEKNGGKIYVESAPNIGTKFKFTIPLNP